MSARVDVGVRDYEVSIRDVLTWEKPERGRLMRKAFGAKEDRAA